MVNLLILQGNWFDMEAFLEDLDLNPLFFLLVFIIKKYISFPSKKGPLFQKGLKPLILKDKILGPSQI